MNDRLDVMITPGGIHQSVKIGVVVLPGDEVFSAYLSCHNFGTWHMALCLEPNKDMEDGCDVEELDEDTAIQILGGLFNVHIYNEKLGVSRF